MRKGKKTQRRLLREREAKLFPFFSIRKKNQKVFTETGRTRAQQTATSIPGRTAEASSSRDSATGRRNRRAPRRCRSRPCVVGRDDASFSTSASSSLQLVLRRQKKQCSLFSQQQQWQQQRSILLLSPLLLLRLLLSPLLWRANASWSTLERFQDSSVPRRNKEEKRRKEKEKV